MPSRRKRSKSWGGGGGGGGSSSGSGGGGDSQTRHSGSSHKRSKPAAAQANTSVGSSVAAVAVSVAVAVAAPTTDSIRAAIQSAIGSSRSRGGGVLRSAPLIPELIEIITTYAAPHITTKTLYEVSGLAAHRPIKILAARTDRGRDLIVFVAHWQSEFKTVLIPGSTSTDALGSTSTGM